MPEKMDAPDCDPALLERTYRHFDVINALFSGWRGVYQRHLRPHLSASQPQRLLDIGFGGGDVPRKLAMWAAQDGLKLEITAIDADARALRYVSALSPVPGVQFRQAMSHELVREGQTFDLVVSNHMLHHLSPAELSTLLEDSQQLCGEGGKVIHSDLERHPLAYALFNALTVPLFRRSLIRHDGLLSIRRSFTPSELRQIAPPGWQVMRGAPFHTLLIYSPTNQNA